PGANPVPGEGSGCSSSRSSAQRDRCARSAWARKWASGRLESEPPRRGAQEERVAALGKVPHTSLSCWSVDNPANSGPGLTVARPHLASVLRGGPWPLSCCSSRMTHGELRARIRQLIALGALPAVPPLGKRDSFCPCGDKEGRHWAVSAGPVVTGPTPERLASFTLNAANMQGNHPSTC